MATKINPEEISVNERNDLYSFPRTDVYKEIDRKEEFSSQELSSLFTALCKSQAEMEVAKKESTNPFFKSNYADLTDVVKCSRPYLAKNGLCIIQRLLEMEKELYLYTRLCHSSGEWIESKIKITLPQNSGRTSDIQMLGSYITYLRRYTYASIVGVIASEEDDDGEKAMEVVRKEPSEPKTTISLQELKILSKELEDMEEVLESILVGYKISRLRELPSSSYATVLKRVMDIKKNRS